MPFKNILVIINTEKDDQLALDKAIQFSEVLGTSITALVLEKHAIPKLLSTINKKLNIAAARGIDVAIEVSTEKDWFSAAARMINGKGFGLVIKEPHAPRVSDHVLLPDDWKLLRNASVPVLLVRSGDEWRQSPVLLCIDANSADEEHQKLNAQIIKVGRFVADVGAAALHLVSAYPSSMQDASKEAQVPTLMEAQYRAGSLRLLGDNIVPDSRIHIDQGPAELLIPEVATQIDAKLVILGTVARSGLQGILLGNTAEQILGRLKTDVLVIPQDS